MEVSAPFLTLGLALMAAGSIMLILSFQSGEPRKSVEYRGMGVIFIGPLPIVLGSSKKWFVVGIALAAVIAVLLLAASMQPNLFGW
jgi:uncharacterized protein (TIGR00304 family)